MKLKRLFARVDATDYRMVRVEVTPETMRDVEWICERYPMEVPEALWHRITTEARNHRSRLTQMETLLADDFKVATVALAKPLRDYQARAVALHAEAKGLLVADSLGLGKTVTAIGALVNQEHRPALVVCPLHLCRQWSKMIGEFLPGTSVHIVKTGPVTGGKPYALPNVDVTICGYSKLAAWGDIFSDGRFGLVVFDEVQEVRCEESQKYKAAEAVAASAKTRLGLSATPIYNYGGEVFNVLEVLAPGRIGSRNEFLREWCTPIGKGKHLIKEPQAFGMYLRDEFLMLRRTRADVGMELPQMEKPVVTVPHDAEVLQKIEGDALELARLVLTAGFEQSGDAAREFDARLRQATGISKAPAVADFVRMLVDNGEKVLLFGWHRAVYDVWRDRLLELCPVFYTGEESEAEKRASLERFALPFDDPAGAKVLIMSLRSGVGVDGIQNHCSTAVFGELDWSPGVHEQCLGRVNRDGVGRGVVGYFLVSAAGSDPVLASVLGLKTAQQRGVVDLANPNEPEMRDPLAMQAHGQRIKTLARQYLQQRGQAVPERHAEEEALLL